MFSHNYTMLAMVAIKAYIGKIKIILKQDCIPVGYIPPTHCLLGPGGVLS